MKPITREQLLTQLNWRYATKQFNPARKISPQDWAALEEALVLTPSSFGLQPWRFIVVTDQTVKQKLVAASWGQRQPADASHLVVFAVKKDLGERDIDTYIERVAQVRGASRESLAGFREMMVGSLLKGRSGSDLKAWVTRQVYIALGNFLTSAALLGIDVCPMEGIVPSQYDEILGLDQLGYAAVVAAAAGYRSETDKHAGLPKVRFAPAEVLLAV